jgi:lactate dehydrogenase-like 2-hydroxyacid dehydrogenase
MVDKPDLLSVGRGMMLASHIETMEREFTVHYMPPVVAEQGPFLKQIADTVRFMQTTGSLGASAALIAALPKLEIIACNGVGVDPIDLNAAKARGIAVTNTPDVLNDCVADLAIGLMIGSARNLAQADTYVRDGKWLKGAMPLQRRVARKKLGILGLGKIGKAIARRAAAFDMEISYHGRNPQKDVSYRYYADLAEMARNVDYLIIICPGGAATRHMVNDKVIRALGPKGTLINVARGSVVDEQALIKALQEKALGFAALDVFADEPRVPAELMALDNVVLAPHVGSGTFETRTDMGNLVVENLLAHKYGRPLLTRVV